MICDTPKCDQSSHNMCSFKTERDTMFSTKMMTNAVSDSVSERLLNFCFDYHISHRPKEAFQKVLICLLLLKL